MLRLTRTLSTTLLLTLLASTRLEASVSVLNDSPCGEHYRQHHSGGAGRSEEAMARELSQLQQFAERALAYREKSIAFYRTIAQKMGGGEPLSGADLDTLNRGMVEHLAIRQQLLTLAHAHECWPALGQAERQAAGMSEVQQLKGVMLSLSAALLLYDNYLLAIATYDDNARLRRLLNAEDSGYRITMNALQKVSISYASIENRSKTRNAIRFYEKQREEFAAEFKADHDFAYLDLLITSSPSYNMTMKWSPLYVLSNRLDLFGEVTTDLLSQFANEGVNLFSMAFGNTLGLVEMRKGKLFGKESISREVAVQLQPGDILLEKTPFRLTDQFIPGHWGHAAIWIGREDELKALGIWDHPLVQPHQQQIRRGHGVVEALRSGVTMSALPHFLNVDDAAVLRQRGLGSQERREIVLQALRQIGKEYDFNFDVESTDRIVCSELVYVSYTGQSWPTEKVLGRSTISPDNVARRALDQGPFELVLFYHDGEAVDKQPLQLMQRLMMN